MRDETAMAPWRDPRPRLGLRRRRTWRRLLALSCLSIATVTAAPANIDTGGFVQDGKTTYCQGIQHDQGPLVFQSLAATSAGKCPIEVQISAASTSVAPSAPLTIHWAASVHQGALAEDLFPHAKDPLTQKPLDVIASLLRACKAGTNCASPDSVIEPAVFPDDLATDTGAFGTGGVKTLKAYQFQFPSPSGGVDDYIIVGKVVLPGDPALNISAQEFVSFQRVRVGTAISLTGSARVRPGDANGTVSDSDVSSVGRPATGRSAIDSGLETRSAIDPPPSPPSGGDGGGGGAAAAVGGGAEDEKREAEGTTSRGSTTSSTKTGGMAPLSIVGIAVFVIAFVLVAYAAVGMRKLKQKKLEAFTQRPTRSFSESFESLDCDPEPLTPMARRKESNDVRRTDQRALTTRDLSMTLPHAQGGVDAARASQVSRVSRQSRVSRVGGGRMKVPGGDAMKSPSARGSGKNWASLGDTVDFTGRQTANRWSAALRAAQQQQATWSNQTELSEKDLRPSQTLKQSRMALRDLEASAVQTNGDVSLQDIPTRTVRVVSTASSTFSVSGGLKSSGVSAFGDSTAIMENTENRRSSVVLLESPRRVDPRESDVSSLGSLHDDSDAQPPPAAPVVTTDPRISIVSRNSRQTRLDEPVVFMTNSHRSSVHSASSGNGFIRLSRSVYRESHKSVTRSVRSVRSGGSGGRTSGTVSVDRSTLEYLRDTSEYDAPFEQRNSESEWMDYQL